MIFNYNELDVDLRDILREEFSKIKVKKQTQIKNLLLVDTFENRKQLSIEKNRLKLVERELKKLQKKVFIPLKGKRTYWN
jgi:uncharacterized protein YlxW (UPF0749 family)